MRHFFRTILTAALTASLAIFTLTNALAQDQRVVNIVIVDREATGAGVEKSGGAGVVRVTQGENVELRWTTDEATELHLHGYNIKIKVAAEGEAVMPVEARAAGRFAIESHGFGADHHAEKTLLYLEVLPR
jgi:FtsP/CotA-like multicopper oxidase with cupredoxin domain